MEYAELLRWAAGLGVGGILAAGMFLVYRKDAAEWSRKETARGDTMTMALIGNTKALTSLESYLRENGRRDY